MPGSYKCHAALIGPCGLGPVQRTAASTLPQIHSSKRRWGPLRSFDDSTSAATCEEETIVTAAHDAIPQAVPPTESLEAAVALPPPQPNPEDSSLPYPSNSVVFSTDGIILSLSVLVAARLGRLSSQEARLDVRRVQRNRERFRALSSDLRQKREAWKAAEAQRLIAEEAQRVAEAAARAKEEARVQEERRRQYEEVRNVLSCCVIA